MSEKPDSLTENTIVLDKDSDVKTKKKKSTRGRPAKKSSSKRKTAKTRTRKTAKKVAVSVSEPEIISDPTIESIEINFPSTISADGFRKRTIKNIRRPHVETIVPTIQEEKETITIEDIAAKAKPVKTKRTLRLNLDFAKPAPKEPPRVIDTSIIESSSFFSEPSVFEKYNLTISDVDDNNKNICENNNPTTEETIQAEPILNSEKIEKRISNMIDKIDSENDTSEEIEENNDDNDIIIEDIQNDSQESNITSIKNHIVNKISGILPDFDSDDFANEVPVAADSIDTPEVSTPSVSAESITPVVRKAKRTISPVFKTFYFEQASRPASIESDIENIYQEVVPSDLSGVSPIEKHIDNAVPEMEIKLDPVKVATPVTTDTTVLTNTDTTTDTDEQELNTPVVTTKDDSSLSINDEIIQELLENEIINGGNSILDEEELDDEAEPEENAEEDIIDPDNSNSLENLPEIEETVQDEVQSEDKADDESEELEELETLNFDEDIDYESINLDEEKEEPTDDDSFSIESYFGLDNISDEDVSDESLVDEPDIVTLDEEVEKELSENSKESKGKENSEFTAITKLLENFNESINNLSDKISDLETQKSKSSNDKVVEEKESTSLTSNSEDEIELSDTDILNLLTSSTSSESSDGDAQIVEDILSETMADGSSEELKNSLISEVLSAEEEIANDNSTNSENDDKIDSDFSKVLECLTKAIKELEDTNNEPAADSEEDSIISNVVEADPVIDDIPEELSTAPATNGDDNKSINILIDKDDIFSIQILNETYEIMADFNAISVLSENINISTPKNNFYVKIGEKYIEIHNNEDHFEVLTNFEDVEFANAINNVGFAKKNNRIELNIKEAFKLASVNNRIELSMLNKTIASIKDIPVTEIDEDSICDNRTLLISEETQKVYLPYTISDVMNKLKYNDNYKSIQDVVDNEYTVPLSTFKMPIISTLIQQS